MALGCGAPAGWHSGRRGRPAGGLGGVGCRLALPPPPASRQDAPAGCAQLLWAPAMVFLLGLAWPRAGETRGLAGATFRLAGVGVRVSDVWWGQVGGGGAYCAVCRSLYNQLFRSSFPDCQRGKRHGEGPHSTSLPLPSPARSPGLSIYYLVPLRRHFTSFVNCSFVNWAKDKGCCEARNYHY